MNCFKIAKQKMQDWYLLCCLSFYFARLSLHSESQHNPSWEGSTRVTLKWVAHSFPDSRVPKGGTCSIQWTPENSHDSSKRKQRECILNVQKWALWKTSIHKRFVSGAQNHDNFLPVKAQCEGAFSHNGCAAWMCCSSVQSEENLWSAWAGQCLPKKQLSEINNCMWRFK